MQIIVTTRTRNAARRLGAAPMMVQVPCLEKDGKFAGDVPADWDIAKARRAAEIVSSGEDISTACAGDGELFFMVNEMLGC